MFSFVYQSSLHCLSAVFFASLLIFSCSSCHLFSSSFSSLFPFCVYFLPIFTGQSILKVYCNNSKHTKIKCHQTINLMNGLDLVYLFVSSVFSLSVFTLFSKLFSLTSSNFFCFLFFSLSSSFLSCFLHQKSLSLCDLLNVGIYTASAQFPSYKPKKSDLDKTMK